MQQFERDGLTFDVRDAGGRGRDASTATPSVAAANSEDEIGILVVVSRGHAATLDGEDRHGSRESGDDRLEVILVRADDSCP